MDLLIIHALDFAARSQALFDDLFTDATGIQAATVVSDADDNVAAFVEGRQLDGAVGRLAEVDTLLGAFQTVIGRVTHHVGQRIADEFEHLTVEFGAFTVHDQVDLLAEFVAEIAHQTGQLLPRRADRLHAGLHHAVLQFAGQGGEALQRGGESGIFTISGNLEELVAGQHHFRNQGHQAFQHIDRNADRLCGGDTLAVFAT